MWTRGVPRLAAALLVGVAGVVLLAQAAASVVRQCLAVDGVVEWLGLHLALLRTGGSCPDGTLAVGGTHGQVLAVLIGTLVPVLLAHLVGALVGLGLLRRARRAVADAVAVLVRRARRPLGRHLPVAGAVPAPPDAAPWTPLRTSLVAAVGRRGPPAVHLA